MTLLSMIFVAIDFLFLIDLLLANPFYIDLFRRFAPKHGCVVKWLIVHAVIYILNSLPRTCPKCYVNRSECDWTDETHEKTE